MPSWWNNTEPSNYCWILSHSLQIAEVKGHRNYRSKKGGWEKFGPQVEKQRWGGKKKPKVSVSGKTIRVRGP